MNRTDRLVAMVMYLQGRRLVKAEELATHFGTSVRTIYRDIAALGESGVPIAGEAGVGYSLVKGYHLPPVMLTFDEASALYVGGEMVKKFSDGSIHEPMNSALLKLRAVLPREHQDQLDRLARNTAVFGPREKTKLSAADRQWLLRIQKAVLKRNVIRIEYRSARSEETVCREVEPLGLMFYGGAWYLVGWCRLRGALRHFRLTRIGKLDTLQDLFEPRADFSLTRHLARPGCEERVIDVQVWFSDAVVERAERESYSEMVKQRVINRGAVYGMRTFSLEWFSWWLLSFGAEAMAMGPARLRSMVKSAAESIAAQYGGSGTPALSRRAAEELMEVSS